MVNGFKVSVAEDSMRGLARGWAPTFIGYSMQGLCKFGLYEVFKNFYSDLLGEVSNLLLQVIKKLSYTDNLTSMPLWLTPILTGKNLPVPYQLVLGSVSQC